MSNDLFPQGIEPMAFPESVKIHEGTFHEKREHYRGTKRLNEKWKPTSDFFMK